LKVMPQHLQWQVLEFVRALAKTEVRGTPGQKLLQFAGSIPADDLQLMREAIEQDYKRLYLTVERLNIQSDLGG